jgi:ankyrin repeat protein
MAAPQEAVRTIFRAVINGDTEGVARMLDEDPRLLSTVFQGHTPLMSAAERPSVGMVRMLLEKGAEVNFANSRGCTALYVAAMKGRDEMVSSLLRSGADPSRRSDEGMTALYAASLFGHVAVVRVLLRHMRGRGSDGRTNDGRTALWITCVAGCAEIVRALLLAGADRNIADNQGCTPLQVAEQKMEWECVAIIEVRTTT